MQNLSGGQEFLFSTMFDFYRKEFLKGLLFLNKQGDGWGILLSEGSLFLLCINIPYIPNFIGETGVGPVVREIAPRVVSLRTLMESFL